MCGICGIYAPGGPAPEPALVKKMMGRLRHRGPDGSGYYRNRTVALGHTRLSIVDVEGGAQPMSNEDGSVWITYNGEVYNAPELRAELETRGHRFRTRCDTEVIVHAYEEWDTKCFSRFNGQWALALWDETRRRLVLSRDRMGIRPLYYCVADGKLLFASEVKALFADPSVPRAPDPVGLRQILGLWSPVAPRTAFADVYQLPPGHVAEMGLAGGALAEAGLVGGRALESKAYWEPHFPAAGEECGTEGENAEALREHLVRAARLRFTRSDVPVGAFVSGGLDSSIIAAILARHTSANLTTFSIRFESAAFDEGKHQSLVTESLGTVHREVLVTRKRIGEVFPAAIRHVERPIVRNGPAPIYILSELVRDSDFKVVVTGEGADEVLGGYDIFREAKIREFIARDPDSAVRSGIVARLYPWMANAPGRTPSFARAFFTKNLSADDFAISHRPRWSAGPALERILSADFGDGAERGDDGAGGTIADAIASAVVEEMPAEAERWDALSRAQWLEMKTLLEPYILSAQGDRMLMAHSVEGRFPFLDHELVEFANQLPSHHKLMGLNEKHLLKSIAAGSVPREILERPKQPYRAPDAASFVGAAEPDWLSDLLSDAAVDRAGLLSCEASRAILSKARAREGANMSNTDNMRLVAIVSTMLWHEEFIADGAASSDAPPPEPMIAIDKTKRSSR